MNREKEAEEGKQERERRVWGRERSEDDDAGERVREAMDGGEEDEEEEEEELGFDGWVEINWGIPRRWKFGIARKSHVAESCKNFFFLF